jgi:LexA-binding, inner membrane-associated putative hydrolase
LAARLGLADGGQSLLVLSAVQVGAAPLVHHREVIVAMTGSSHAYVGVAVATGLAAAGVLPVTPVVLVAVALGGLAPDIDMPRSTLGTMLSSVSVECRRLGL